MAIRVGLTKTVRLRFEHCVYHHDRHHRHRYHHAVNDIEQWAYVIIETYKRVKLLLMKISAPQAFRCRGTAAAACRSWWWWFILFLLLFLSPCICVCSTYKLERATNEDSKFWFSHGRLFFHLNFVHFHRNRLFSFTRTDENVSWKISKLLNFIEKISLGFVSIKINR